MLHLQLHTIGLWLMVDVPGLCSMATNHHATHCVPFRSQRQSDQQQHETLLNTSSSIKLQPNALGTCQCLLTFRRSFETGSDILVLCQLHELQV